MEPGITRGVRRPANLKARSLQRVSVSRPRHDVPFAQRDLNFFCAIAPRCCAGPFNKKDEGPTKMARKINPRARPSDHMGRIGMEGGSLGSFKDVFTPLDLFRYQSPNVRDLQLRPDTFIRWGIGGATNVNAYNNPQNGGDAADWASNVLNDSYDAFGTPGVVTHVSSTDLLEVASLGYTLNSSGLADLKNNTSIVA